MIGLYWRKLSQKKKIQIEVIGIALVVFLFASSVLSVASASSTYTCTLQWGQKGSGNGDFNGPWGIAVDDLGYVYVVDRSNYRVEKFDGAGSFVLSWGGFGSSDGNFKAPGAIAVDSAGVIYVSDSQLHSVQRFTSTGTFDGKITTLYEGDGSMSRPIGGLTVDSQRNVYITDLSSNSILKYDSTGVLFTQFGNTGSPQNRLNSPRFLAVDASDNIYVVDQGNSRIQKYDNSGNLLSTWPVTTAGTLLMGIAIDPNGNAYVTQYRTGSSSSEVSVIKIDPTGTRVCDIGSYGTNIGQFVYPFSVATYGYNTIYVVDMGSSSSDPKILKFEQVPPFPFPEVPFGTTIVSIFAALSVFTSIKYLKRKR